MTWALLNFPFSFLVDFWANIYVLPLFFWVTHLFISQGIYKPFCVTATTDF